jgi:exopolyphosphatase/guanosine-5'-triphosphate,3'-diphosphate pyrophosphatase
MESYRVGSIAWSARYFPDNQFSKHAFQMAEIAAKALLDEALNAYRREDWDLAYGSAGTVGAVGDVLVAAGWPEGAVDRAGLDWLQDKLINAQSSDRIRLPGLKEDRRTIIGGGLSILRAVFDLLQIDQMQLATGGLRHGVLFNLAGNSSDQTDVRPRSVQRLASKFGTDLEHGLRVSKVALHMFSQLQSHQKPSVLKNERPGRKLGWAAQLHEIGSRISHADYHKHGAYILDNSDAMGFTLSELHRLSLLVLGHRGKLRKLEIDFEDGVFMEQLLTLRLAVILCHARRDPDLGGLQLSRPVDRDKTFTLSCRPKWAQSYPQSAHLLREEVLAWQKIPWSLTLSGC